MRWPWLRVAVLIILGAMITACATPSFPPPSVESFTAWQARKPSLDQLRTWQLTGRVVIKTEDDTFSGVIFWSQEPDAYQIDFKTPLGQSVLQLQGNSQHVVMTLPNQKQYQAENAESLMYNKLGWGLPIKALASWAAGLPVADAEQEFLLDADGHIQKLRQSGWNIHYKRYTRAGVLQLPNKIFMDNNDDELNIRLVIDKWIL